MTRDVYNAVNELKKHCAGTNCGECEFYNEECMNCSLKKIPFCYDMESIKNRVEEPTTNGISQAGEIKVTSNDYLTLISILLANGYIITSTMVDGDYYYIHYGKCQ